MKKIILAILIIVPVLSVAHYRVNITNQDTRNMRIIAAQIYPIHAEHKPSKSYNISSGATFPKKGVFQTLKSGVLFVEYSKHGKLIKTPTHIAKLDLSSFEKEDLINIIIHQDNEKIYFSVNDKAVIPDIFIPAWLENTMLHMSKL